MKRLLIFVDWFSPAFRAGGPIQSCINLAQLLSEEFEIFIATSDRDLGDHTPFDNVILDKWIHWRDDINVIYLSKKHLEYGHVKGIITEISPHYIYLNSMFSRFFTIYPLLIHQKNYRNQKLILAPRGMLQDSALSFKKTKKKIYLSIIKKLGMFKNIVFHATSRAEEEAIKKNISSKAAVHTATNIPKPTLRAYNKIKKVRGEVKCVCVARIHPVKGILFFLKLIASSNKKINFSLVGPIENTAYWLECQNLIKKLPDNIKFHYHGKQSPEEVNNFLENAHLFVLPTQGENFGHSIFEAFSMGRPVLISDKTPWLNLSDKKAGWDISLDSMTSWKDALEKVIMMNQVEYDNLNEGAFKLAQSFFNNQNLKKQYLDLFS